MVAFEKWLVNEYPKVLPKGRMGKAIKYTYEIYHRLTRYHLDGRYRIDNNLAENSIRPLALGRKNYLLAGGSVVFYLELSQILSRNASGSIVQPQTDKNVFSTIDIRQITTTVQVSGLVGSFVGNFQYGSPGFALNV